MCDDVEAYLKSKRDYKLTYKNKERSLTPFDQERSLMFEVDPLSWTLICDS